MIVLTGDLHHQSLGTGNQQHCEITEIQTAQRYMSLLREREIPVTFFVSGKAFEEEWEDLVEIADDPLVELGGHNYSCFQPELLHRVTNKLVGSYNGTRAMQRRDANLTIAMVKRRTGKRIRTWRNHMYMHGPFTEEVLAGVGIDICSDGTKRDSMGPTQDATGVWSWPINVIPDHEHLYHAERTRDWVQAWQKRYNWEDDWGPDSYEIEEWCDIALADLKRNEARGATSMMIVHPITMYLCDKFAGITKILDFIADHNPRTLGEAAQELCKVER